MPFADEAVSAAQMQMRLKSSLAQSGVLGSLKCQLRNKLIADLRGSMPGQPGPVAPRKVPKDLMQQVADSLVAEHMKTSGYEYSLAVFLPESGNQPQTLLSHQSILGALSFGSEVKESAAAAERTGHHTVAAQDDPRGFLVSVLEQLGEAATTARGSARAQPGTSSTAELGAKLRGIDSQFEVNAQEQLSAAKAAIEKRMYEYQRECDRRCTGQLAIEKERFESDTLVKMRIEERARFRTQLAETETRFEGALVQRLKDVERKEQEADERIRKREADSAKLMFTERQRVLEKIDSTAALELDVKREAAISSRTLRLQEEATRHTQEQLLMREAAFEGLKEHYEEHYERKLKEEIATVKLEVAQANEARKQELDIRERKLHSEIALVAQQQLIHERMVVDLSDAKSENDKLQTEMQDTCSRLGSAMTEKDMLTAKLEAMSDYDVIVRQASFMRRDFQKLQEDSTAVQGERDALAVANAELRLKLEATARQLTQPTLEVIELRELAISQKADCKSLRDRLALTDDRAEDLHAQHDHDQAQLKEARVQVDDLRTLLQQTLQAAAYRGMPRVQPVVSTASASHPRDGGSQQPTAVNGLAAVHELRRRLDGLGSGLGRDSRADFPPVQRNNYVQQPMNPTMMMPQMQMPMPMQMMQPTFSGPTYQQYQQQQQQQQQQYQQMQQFPPQQMQMQQQPPQPQPQPQPQSQPQPQPQVQHQQQQQQQQQRAQAPTMTAAAAVTSTSAIASPPSPPVTTALPASTPTQPHDQTLVQQPTTKVHAPLSTAIDSAAAAAAAAAVVAAAKLSPTVPKATVASVKATPSEGNKARPQPKEQTKITSSPHPTAAVTPPRATAAAVATGTTRKVEPKPVTVEAASNPQPDFRARMEQRKAEKAREALASQAREAREAERLKLAEEEAARKAARDDEQRKREVEATREQDLLNERIRAREEAVERQRTAEVRRKQQEEDEAKAKRVALETKAAANLDVYTARVLEARKAKAAEAAAAQPVGTSTPGPRGALAAEEEDSVPVSEGEMSVGGMSAGGGDESFAESVSDGSYVSSYGGGAGGEVMW